MRDPNNPCLFCNAKASGIAHENDLAYASYDTYPVSKIFLLEHNPISDLELSNFDKCFKIFLYFKFLNSGF